MQPFRQLSPRRTAILLSCGLLVLCLIGVLTAIEGGHHPGKHPRGVIRPYPTEAVIQISSIITVETVVLFCILRPGSFSRRPRRAPIALAIFGLLWIADFFLISGWTDQAGYAYANGGFLCVAVVFLAILSVLTLSLQSVDRNLRCQS